MVELKNIGGNIEVLGTFDFGYMGNYTGEKISFADIEELREWDCIMKKIDVSKSTDEEVIKCLEEYGLLALHNLTLNPKSLAIRAIAFVGCLGVVCVFATVDMLSKSSSLGTPPNLTKLFISPLATSSNLFCIEKSR